MLTVNELALNTADRQRLLDIKSRVLLGMHVSREDRQWVLDTVARTQVPVSARVVEQAAREGLRTDHINVL